MAYWMAKTINGGIVDGRSADWDNLVKKDIVVLYLRVGDQTITLPRGTGGYFFEYKAASMTMALGKEKLYQAIGVTTNDQGDCILVLATEDGDVLIGKDNIHFMNTFDLVGHLNFKLHDIGLGCSHA